MRRCPASGWRAVDGAYMVPVGYAGYELVSRPWLEGLWANPLTWATLDEVVVRPH